MKIVLYSHYGRGGPVRWWSSRAGPTASRFQWAIIERGRHRRWRRWRPAWRAFRLSSAGLGVVAKKVVQSLPGADVSDAGVGSVEVVGVGPGSDGGGALVR